jgi:hypothetical protein
MLSSLLPSSVLRPHPFRHPSVQWWWHPNDATWTALLLASALALCTSCGSRVGPNGPDINGPSTAPARPAGNSAGSALAPGASCGAKTPAPAAPPAAVPWFPFYLLSGKGRFIHFGLDAPICVRLIISHFFVASPPAKLVCDHGVLTEQKDTTPATRASINFRLELPDGSAAVRHRASAVRPRLVRLRDGLGYRPASGAECTLHGQPIPCENTGCRADFLLDLNEDGNLTFGGATTYATLEQCQQQLTEGARTPAHFWKEGIEDHLSKGNRFPLYAPSPQSPYILRVRMGFRTLPTGEEVQLEPEPHSPLACTGSFLQDHADPSRPRARLRPIYLPLDQNLDRDVGFPIGAYTGRDWFMETSMPNSNKAECVRLTLQTNRPNLAGEPYPLRPSTSGTIVLRSLDDSRPTLSELSFVAAGRDSIRLTELVISTRTFAERDEKVIPVQRWSQQRMACNETLPLAVLQPDWFRIAGIALEATEQECTTRAAKDSHWVDYLQKELPFRVRNSPCLNAAVRPLVE